MRVITASDLRRMQRRPVACETPYRARFSFAGIVTELVSDEPALIEHMRRKYAYHLSGAQPYFTYSVTTVSRGYALWCSHDGGWEWTEGALQPDALAFLTDAALMSAVVHWDAALRSMHAAAVAIGGRAAIITGNSFAGKTTTLLACARSGLQILSDERGLLRDGQLYPFIRTCEVREHGRALLMCDNGNDALARALHAETFVDPVRCFGADVVAAPAPLTTIVVLAGRAERARVDPIGVAQALPALSRWFDMRGDGFDRLGGALNTLRRCTCYALTLGTPADSARAVRAALERA